MTPNSNISLYCFGNFTGNGWKPLINVLIFSLKAEVFTMNPILDLQKFLDNIGKKLILLKRKIAILTAILVLSVQLKDKKQALFLTCLSNTNAKHEKIRAFIFAFKFTNVNLSAIVTFVNEKR